MSLLSFLTGHGGRVIVVVTKADTLMQSLTSYRLPPGRPS